VGWSKEKAEGGNLRPEVVEKWLRQSREV